ncbi:MAG TPA: helix-turn-helix transcriptional regulator, partial [Ktedonobacteraceae bacterium]|nr:helix-turn-helix transcriptional regulator [Ktedonobacteraceae bacterium]
MAKNDRKFPLNAQLRDARVERGWSQQDLADRIGTTSITISRWENGSTFPTPYSRQLLCKVFDKTPTELGLVPPAQDSTLTPTEPGLVLPAQDSTLTPAEPDLVPPPAQGSRIVDIPIMRNPFFTGREDLLALLHERLSTERTAALTQPQALY